MSNVIVIRVDLDLVGRTVEDSIRAVMTQKGLSFADEHDLRDDHAAILREMGNNVANAIVMLEEPCSSCGHVAEGNTCCPPRTVEEGFPVVTPTSDDIMLAMSGLSAAEVTLEVVVDVRVESVDGERRWVVSDSGGDFGQTPEYFYDDGEQSSALVERAALREAEDRASHYGPKTKVVRS